MAMIIGGVTFRIGSTSSAVDRTSEGREIVEEAGIRSLYRNPYGKLYDPKTDPAFAERNACFARLAEEVRREESAQDERIAKLMANEEI